jgi:hypothetical protein
MGLGPIPGIRAAEPVNASAGEPVVAPTLALGRSRRMQDDAGNAQGDEPERGMEEEDAETAEQDKMDSSEDSDAPAQQIDFFA